ncbi:MAG TPA: winged helix DNA-binding protein [Actinomycetales bacterium]|nr:winged helix DNA-binding protein [Actinomycetales bacterium]
MARIDDRQATFAGVLLLANRMQTTYDAAIEEVTLKQWLALVVVASLPRPVPSTAEVARALGTTHQNMRKLLAALADRGLLEITPSPTDRRARRVDITPAAHALFDRLGPTGDRLLDDLFADVAPDDLSTCLRVLDTMSLALTGDSLRPPEPETERTD